MRIRSRLALLTLMLSLLTGCMHSSATSTNTDPYRWLESPVSSQRMKTWLQQQAQITHGWRQQQPMYQQTRDQLHAAWDHRKWRVAAIQGGQVFFYFNAGLDDHYSLYQQSYRAFVADRARDLSPVSSARLLLGGEVFDGDTSPGAITISPDAKWLAYQIGQHTPSGERQSLWYLQSLTDSSAEPTLLGVKYKHWTLPAERLAWGQDGDRLFFTVSVPPDPAQMAGNKTFAKADWQSRVYDRQLTITRSAPELLFTAPDWHQIEQLQISGNRLLMAVADQSGAGNINSLRWAFINPGASAIGEQPRLSWLTAEPAKPSASNPVQYVGNIRGVPAFLHPGALGTGAIVLADEHQWRTLIPASEAPLRSALVLGDKLVLEYLVHGSSSLQVADLNGRPADNRRTLALPSPVRIEALGATSELQLLTSYSGILTPPRTVLIDLHSTQQTTLTSDRPGLALSDFRATLVRVYAPDGTRIPVWIADSGRSRGRDHTLMLLEVYGGFAAPMETSFSISRLAWLASGGALAVAGPRGGGDYGTSWHEAGRAGRRHNSVADVLAVAEWLRSERLSDNDGLAISGRSHGGLLAAEVVHQAPDLFAALLTDAAVFDLMRLDALGGARFWQQEYRGVTSSPYETLLTGGRELARHPPTLLITRVNDAVVAPAHTFKYLQALQDKLSPAHVSALLSVSPGSAHDDSGRVTDLIADYALRWTFLNSQLVMDRNRTE